MMERVAGYKGYYVMSEMTIEGESADGQEYQGMNFSTGLGYMKVTENNLCHFYWDLSSNPKNIKRVTGLFKHFKPNGKEHIFQCFKDEHVVEVPNNLMPLQNVTYEVTNEGMVLLGIEGPLTQKIVFKKM